MGYYLAERGLFVHGKEDRVAMSVQCPWLVCDARGSSS